MDNIVAVYAQRNQVWNVKKGKKNHFWGTSTCFFFVVIVKKEKKISLFLFFQTFTLKKK